MSKHIGLLLTKYPERMVDYVFSQPKIRQAVWQEKLWLGF